MTAMTIYGPIPAGGFPLIYADPAWKFASNSEAKPGRNALRHYPCMKTPDICAMPVREIAATDALCFLWATSPMLTDALEVMKAWGLKYLSHFVWEKERIGTGYWIRNRHELLLLGKRGRFPCGRKAPFPTSVVRGGQTEHSAKPPYWQNRIEELWPDLPKLEMFSRQWRLGWAAHGNEVPTDETPLRDGAGGTVVHPEPARARGLLRGAAKPNARLPAEVCLTGGMGGDREASGEMGAERPVGLIGAPGQGLGLVSGSVDAPGAATPLLGLFSGVL